jgi:peroxiredoxin Q/BCP
LPSHRLESDPPDKIGNISMIEPPKATKGRRMSKKSRKKSPKTALRRAPSAKSPRAPKTKGANSRQAAAKSITHAIGGPSHKGASKRLKSSTAAARSKSVPTTGAAVEKPAALVEGAKAPTFRLTRDGGSPVALSDFKGRKLVLFFYPRADTPGCTREAIDFTRLSSAFADSGTVVLGISGDPVKTQEKFRDKHKLSIPLISDENHEMLQAYGAWGEKSMYGKTFEGILRTTVLIGADGRVARIWRHVKVDGHADAVLEAAKVLGT